MRAATSKVAYRYFHHPTDYCSLVDIEANFCFPPDLSRILEENLSFDTFDAKNRSVRVALCQGKAIGYASLFLKKGFYKLGRVIVHPDFHRQGIATNLIKWARAHLRENCRNLKVMVPEDNVAALKCLVKNRFIAYHLHKDIFTHCDGIEMHYVYDYLDS